MGKNIYFDAVNKVSYGVCKNLTNFLLYSFFLTASSIGKQGSRGVYESFRETDEILEKINYDTITAALRFLLRQSKIIKDNNGTLRLSPQTYRKLEEEAKLYQKKRIWNGKIYLVLYDIPTHANKMRSLLRQFLKEFGAASLEDSVYICLYNLRSSLKEFINSHKIPGVILVTEMTEGSSIGDEPLKQLINRVYQTDKLNQDYYYLWQEIKGRNKLFTKYLFRFMYLNKSDPKLPLQFLPKPWYGSLVEEFLQKKGMITDNPA